MNLLQAAVLGVTQGLAEFAPISSSGHLILVPWAFGWDDVLRDANANKAFDAVLHLGTFVGAAWCLRDDLWRLVRAWFRSVRSRQIGSVDQRLAWLLVLSAVPGALVGATAENAINIRLGEPWQIAFLLAVFGVVLWAVDRHAGEQTAYEGIGAGQAAAMAVGQALALAPGVSRSGITITVARATRLTRDAAARFSFLMSLPITLGAGVFGLTRLGEGPASGTTLAVGTVAAAVTGGLAVWWLLAFVRRHSFGSFMVYRLVVAAGVFALIAANVRDATVGVMTTVLLVRHGLTSLTGSVLAGWTPGVHLDERGQAQVADLAKRLAPLPVAAVVSSPLERCRETAAALVAGRDIEVTMDDRLGECLYGEWTGQDLRRLAKDPLWRQVQVHPSAVTFPGGEALRETAARAVAAVRDGNALYGPEATWVAVSHGDVIKAIVADALGLHLDQFQRIHVDPCSLTVIRYTELRPFVVRLNDIGGGVADLLPPKRKRRQARTSDAVVGGGAGRRDA